MRLFDQVRARITMIISGIESIDQTAANAFSVEKCSLDVRERWSAGIFLASPLTVKPNLANQDFQECPLAFSETTTIHKNI